MILLYMLGVLFFKNVFKKAALNDHGIFVGADAAGNLIECGGMTFFPIRSMRPSSSWKAAGHSAVKPQR